MHHFERVVQEINEYFQSGDLPNPRTVRGLIHWADEYGYTMITNPLCREYDNGVDTVMTRKLEWVTCVACKLRLKDLA